MKNNAMTIHTVSAAQKAMGARVLCVCAGAAGENTRGNSGLALLLSTGMGKKRIS